MKNELKIAQQINREYLKSIDIQEIIELEKEKLNDGELKARAGSAYSFWKAYFKKVLTLMTFLQTMKIGKEAETQEQILYCRGVLGGLQIVEKWFEKQENITISKFAPEEDIETTTGGE